MKERDEKNFNFEETKRLNDSNKKRLEDERLKQNAGVLSRNNIKKPPPSKTETVPPPTTTKRQFPEGKIVTISTKRSPYTFETPSHNSGEKIDSKEARKPHAQNAPFQGHGLGQAKILPLRRKSNNTQKNSQEASSKNLLPYAPKSLPSNFLGAIHIDKNSRLYTTYLDHQTGEPQGLAISFDDGQTWVSADKKNWKYVDKISTELDGFIYMRSLASVSGKKSPTLRFSLDGRSWNELPLRGCPSGKNISYAVGPRGEIFAGTSEGAFVSKDRGTSWVSLTNPSGGLRGGPIYDIKLGSSALGLGHFSVYILSALGLYASDDSGKTWRLSSRGDMARSSTLHIDKGGVIYLGYYRDGLKISRDGGKTWVVKNVFNGLGSNNIRSIQSRAGLIVVAHLSEDGRGGGLSISKDGGLSWTSMTKENSPLAENEVTGVAISHGGAIYAATLGGGLFVSDNRQAHWVSISMETTGSYRVNP